MESKKIIGHCELNFQNEIPRLSRILIGDKQYRGMGYGKKTIKLMIHEILNLRPETNKVDLRVFKWNENAIKLYLKLGFKIIPNNTLTFNYSKNETWVDMNMQKQLK
jgi:RimJ/RimL family protein N-acetyltransferase